MGTDNMLLDTSFDAAIGIAITNPKYYNLLAIERFN